MNYHGFDDKRVKHLEMIQAVIARLAGNSFVIKGASATITTALAGFALNNDQPLLGLLAGSVVMVMWALDAHFLRAERYFRRLFDHVRIDSVDGPSSIGPFSMAATSPSILMALGVTSRAKEYRRALVSVTLVLYYGALTAAGFGAALGLALS